ncbi:MAG: SMP-30/gluconolactonase/LRE family protein [Bacteroidales bacterium]|nr:SMP-30/gluconolactonase/LRE family protein [Bacteroidales bacterium]
MDEVDGHALNKPNDLAFDGEGNILFTCPRDSRSEPTGYVCMAKPDRIVRKIATDMYFPNGLAFTENGSTLVVAETYKHRLWKGKWDSTNCLLSEFKPWVHVGGPIGPEMEWL